MTDHPRALALPVLVPLIAMSALGAVIGIQLLTSLGVTPNTALIGALLAMVAGRIPIGGLRTFRSIHAQNLAQSAMSAATFGAANSLLLPIGIPFLLGRPDLVRPLLAGVAMAMFLDAWMLYRMFGTTVFPATGAWPPGAAAAEAIQAGDSGGRQGLLLVGSIAIGALGSRLGVPMAAFGTAFIGNVWALAMFGVGLLASAYSPSIIGADILAKSIPHGIMIGAGLVALAQVAVAVRDDRQPQAGVAGASRAGSGATAAGAAVTSDRGGAAPGANAAGASVRAALRTGALGYLAIALFIAVAGGIATDLGPLRLAGFVLYAAFAAFVHELIVGLAAMHSGWFPAFAVALITLLVGILAGFPPVPLALLAGFSVATGPAFADMGYDLKAGFMLRGEGRDPSFELAGRQQQLLAAMTAFAVAAVVVLLSWKGYFDRDLFPPVARVYAATIRAGAASGVAGTLVLWAIPGALLQSAGGPQRQLGVLLSTGLLIANAGAGWAVLAGIALRLLAVRLHQGPSARDMEVVAAGFIAGDALYAFGDAMVRRLAAPPRPS